MSVSFHRRIGIRPGWALTFDDYGCGIVLGIRMGWSYLTLTILNVARRQNACQTKTP